MFQNYNKNSDNVKSSSNNIFNVSGQNIMSNKNIDAILKENRELRKEINMKNKEIENAKKKLNILEKQIKSLKNQNNNQIKIRGRSVGMRNNINLNNFNNIGFNGGMLNNNDPFNDSFFKFNVEN